MYISLCVFIIIFVSLLMDLYLIAFYLWTQSIRPIQPGKEGTRPRPVLPNEIY